MASPAVRRDASTSPIATTTAFRFSEPKENLFNFLGHMESEKVMSAEIHLDKELYFFTLGLLILNAIFTLVSTALTNALADQYLAAINL